MSCERKRGSFRFQRQVCGRVIPMTSQSRKSPPTTPRSMAAKGHNAARTLQAALLASLAAIAWQPATVQADAQSSRVEIAGWHAAGSRRTPPNSSANYGEIQQVTYLEPVTT